MDRPSAIYESEKQLKALADVLEGKEYKNTGATRGQSKWLKYIAELTERNQFFGIKMTETEIMPEQTLTFIDNKDEGVRIFDGHATLNGDNIVLGEIYDVKIDDALYKVECRDVNGMQILGNATFVVTGNPSYNDTGEPFAIRLFFDGENSGMFGMTTLEAGDHTISINGLTRTIIKIPKIFLPDDIGGGSSVQSDWNQTDTTASDYIKNKPTISEQVQADWNQTNATAKDYIKNKPTIIGKTSVNQYGSVLGEVFNNYNNNAANGFYSHAEGSDTKASGSCSHAEGKKTTASGDYSHAEGWNTKASEQHSHAEGDSTEATGYCSHAEGSDTKASGQHSHAEGYYTLASSKYQHVQGKFNISDTTDTYAHIVGNGLDYLSRSNAHTLDWNGNAWYAGTVEGTAMIVKSSTEGSSKRFKITVDDTGTITATEITA